MIRRCTSEKSQDYPRYGGRGIKVCDRWLYGELDKSGFECFLSDMGPKPFSRATIERNNNDGEYGPGNCRWADRRAQSRNRSNNVSVTLRGRGMLLKDALTELGASTSSYYYLKRLGYSEQKAIDRLAGVYRGPPA